jgi:molybdopterin-guanine dinucleotide biosynthesis protein A
MCAGGQPDSVPRGKTKANPPQVSGVILAGGKSTRFGSNKAFLRLGGQLLIERAVEKLGRLSDDLILVANEPAAFRALGLAVRLVRDIEPGKGSIMGVYSGLQAARYPFALTVACDMPFLNVPLLRYMIPMTHGHDVVIPYLDGHLEPLHAIYSRTCLSAMDGVLKQGRRRIISFFDRVRVRRVDAREVDIFDPQRLSVLNVNTHADWALVQELLALQRKQKQIARSPG